VAHLLRSLQKVGFHELRRCGFLIFLRSRANSKSTSKSADEGVRPTHPTHKETGSALAPFPNRACVRELEPHGILMLLADTLSPRLLHLGELADLHCPLGKLGGDFQLSAHGFYKILKRADVHVRATLQL
jgi:hypothetical protein